MGFLTKLDYSNNRQIKQFEKSSTVLSGGTKFGMSYSALTTGPDLTYTGVTQTYTNLVSTFSGNSGTTIFTWYDANMALADNIFSAITPTNSADTQNSGLIFTANTTGTTVDGYTYAIDYSGVSFDLVGLAMIDLGGGDYSGSVHTNILDFYSASSYDYSGSTIWVDVSGKTRTEEIIITKDPQVGYVLTCIDLGGNTEWQPSSGGTSGGTGVDTYWVSGSTWNGTNYPIKANNGSPGDALGNYSLSEGYNTIASGNYSHAEGLDTQSLGVVSHAEGSASQALGDISHAEGAATTASGNYSHTEGSNTTATGSTSHAEGNGTLAGGDYSHSEGSATSALGDYSHAEGESTTASGRTSHAEGVDTLSGGDYSHAEGYLTTTIGIRSHAEGSLTTASGTSAHAEGGSTTAGGDFSHTEGNNTITIGLYSHAGGLSSTASGATSFVHGSGSQAHGTSTIVLGDNITGTSDNTTYVEDLIIDGLVSTDPIATDADGRIVAGGSDARLKKNIKPLGDSLSKIKNLRGVSFEYTDESNMGGGVRYGFIAQEVQNIFPTIVRERAKGDRMLSLNYTEIIPLLVEAVKELTRGVATSGNTYLETQSIIAEDNNIDLNFNGNEETAIGGGIRVLHGFGQGKPIDFLTDASGNWVTNNDLKPKGIIIPLYTPTSSDDLYGVEGNITRGENYLYIKTKNGWKRSALESF